MNFEEHQFEVSNGHCPPDAEPPGQAQQLHRRDARRTATCAGQRSRTTRAIRVLVLTGAGRGFCAGQDLADPAWQMGRQDAGHRQRGRTKLQAPGAAPAKPARADHRAVNGIAAGAGASLALACDLVIASQIRLLPAGLQQDRPDSRTPAAPGSCRSASAWPAPWAWPCWPTNCPPKRPPNGA
jgi:2-(1,2-epoxy-1,2-dihydrophenyl)acetyl-CoA isomerase